MKINITISLLLALLIAVSPARGQVFRYNIHIDPLTTAAIQAQTNTLVGAYNKRINLQTGILAQETIIGATLKGIHDLQSKTLEYLSNAQAAISNLRQIGEIADLALHSIPAEAQALVADVADHPDGTLAAVINRSLVADVVEEASELTPLIANLVKSATVKKRSDGSIEPNNQVNLLNGAERLKVANDVLFRLRNMYSTLRSMRTMVKYSKFKFIEIDIDVEQRRRQEEEYLKRVVDELRNKYWS